MNKEIKTTIYDEIITKHRMKKATKCGLACSITRGIIDPKTGAITYEEIITKQRMRRRGVWIAKNTREIIDPKTGAITWKKEKYVIVVAKNKRARRKK